ncbi:MAG: histidinol-phosphate transaminase [Pseudomonadota bacterium]|jgi:histidinol-phosphate aminotransferase
MNIADRLGRPDLRTLQAYALPSASTTHVRLHANENPWRAVGDDTMAGLAHYPEPTPATVGHCLATLYDVPTTQLLATRGADEGIDLLTRGFLRAGVDAALVCPPTFGMYAIATRIQGADLIEVPLRPAPHFDLDAQAVITALQGAPVKLVFLCSPGNPTGTTLAPAAIEAVLHATRERTLVVIDEAYVEFSQQSSWIERLHEFPHLVVLRTLSKAYSLAGARVGSVIADPSIIALLSKLLPPYSMSTGTIEATLRALAPAALPIATARIERLIGERNRLAVRLRTHPAVLAVSPSSSNFLFVTVTDPVAFLTRANAAGFLLRDCTRDPRTPLGIRISVSAPDINDRLLEALSTP